jgi:cell division protein FtsZ
MGVISRPGLINIDFADLKTILLGKGKILFFGEGIAHGPNRAEEAVKNIFQNPFCEGEPKRVKKMLFNVTGGKDLGLKEVETVSNQIAKLNPKAKIIFGISEDPTYNGKIKVTLLCVSDTEKSE